MDKGGLVWPHRARRQLSQIIVDVLIVLVALPVGFLIDLSCNRWSGQPIITLQVRLIVDQLIIKFFE